MSKEFRAKVVSEAKEMFDSPHSDWKMEDIVRVAERAGLSIRRPTRGSHYSFGSPHSDQILTVPYNRPIRGVYVKRFAVMVRNHLSAQEEQNGK